MQDNVVSSFGLGAEIARLFDPSSEYKGGVPVAVVLMGAPSAGKTTLRKEKYSRGYVLIDAADLFESMSGGTALPFPDGVGEALNMCGRLLAYRAVSERRNIVTEILGIEKQVVHALLKAMQAAGYKVELILVSCSIEDALSRARSRPQEEISAREAEPFNCAWLTEACHCVTGRDA